ncbi:MAG: TMEM165/GDT1 family protein [Deltaproteobacteria bacterium]|jgi:putative Ca2+/H+ antiporter (TMEM165/GDT1 family)|nr:TMEM165/GDT1 family protein [Deltaproteobacteria bacterium]
MDWTIFFSTFITIFLAEMGDKTQFAALAAGSKTNSTISVWLAVVLALGLAGTLGVFFGKYLGTLIHPEYLKYLSGGLFILIGIYILLQKN